MSRQQILFYEEAQLAGPTNTGFSNARATAILIANLVKRKLVGYFHALLRAAASMRNE